MFFFLGAIVFGALIWFAAYRFLSRIRNDHSYGIGSENKYMSFLTSLHGKSAVNETDKESIRSQVSKQNDRIVRQFLESMKIQKEEVQWSLTDLWKPVAEWKEEEDDSLPVIVFTSLENPVLFLLFSNVKDDSDGNKVSRCVHVVYG